jgi:hypothetical protein
MWSEWLVRTLSPRRGDDADPTPRPRKPPRSRELADDKLCPDEYEAALAAVEESE